MKIWLFIVIAGMVLATGACAPMFMVGKCGSDARGVWLGSKSKSTYELMCASGELEKVLAATHLSREMKDALYKSNCSAERSAKELRKVYGSMTRAERKDIKTAFKKFGYSINGGSC
jgi:hypothetical protein